MKEKGLMDKGMEIVRKHKWLEYGLYAAIIGLVLLLYFGGDLFSKKAPVISSSSNLEERLQKTLSTIKGAGQVKVMISYETSSQKVPAKSTDEQSSVSQGTQSQSISSKPITEKGGEPLVLYEIEPQIRGVIVVAEGAEDISVRLNLLKAAQIALNVEAGKVEVFSMNKVGGEKK